MHNKVHLEITGSAIPFALKMTPLADRDGVIFCREGLVRIAEGSRRLFEPAAKVVLDSLVLFVIIVAVFEPFIAQIDRPVNLVLKRQF